jgi:subtilase family serine protease
MHFANVTDVQLPSAFAGVVAAVTGLHDFRFKPRVHASVVRPEFTSSQTGNHFLAPADIYTIYNVNSLATSATGTGETIAVVGQVDIFTADVLAFRSAAGLSATNLPTTIHAFGTDPGNALSCSSCTNGPNQGDLDESSIDVEWSGAMAPSATIDFVNDVNVLPGPTGTDAMTYTIDNNLAPIVTTSYGNCEAAWGSTELVALNLLFKQANSQGQTILAAAGDNGAADCDSAAYPDTGEAIEGDAVDFPGSSPYVTSMGGTQFSGDAEATGSGSTWAATQYWAGTSGSDVTSSALGYIPETVWNDVTGGYASFGGGGGGPSTFFTKPAWQVGTPSDASRDVPDIALTASDAHDPFLYCVNVAAANGAQSCTSGFRISGGGLTVAGGTSFDSQIFGGMLALVEQKLGSRLGNINPTLYALGNSSNKTAVFNDITTGSNAMPCIAGTPNCGNGGSTGFNAAAGYDLASGWGSVNVSNLAADWTKVTPLCNALTNICSGGNNGGNTSVTTLTALPSTVAAGATVTLTATVTGAAATPTGTVTFLANNAALGTPVALNGNPATATYSWVTSCSTLGQTIVAASYSGDNNYQGSKGPALATGESGYTGGAGLSSNGSVVVSPIEVQVSNNSCPDFSVTPSGTGVTVSGSNASLTVAAGGTIPPVTIAAAPINGFTGVVTFSATVTSTTGYSPTLTFSPTSVTIPSSAESTTLTLSGITADLRVPTAPGKFDPGTTVAQRNPGRAPAARESWYAAGSGVAIASMLLLTVPRRRRRLGGLLLVALAVAMIGGAAGCGGSSQSGPPTTSTNPYAGVYYVNVVATYTSGSTVTTHSFEVTYSIN